MDVVTLTMDAEYVFRIVLAAICGAFIGLEREKRQKSAGLRTHIIVALASSLMMIVSKYGFFDVVIYEGVSVDVSRVAAGVVSAIGFIGGGVIFMKRDALVGLTTAAGLWATVGVGIAIGAGLYIVGVFTTLFILVIQLAMHWKKLKSVSSVAGNITVNLSKQNMSIDEVRERLEMHGIYLRNISISKNKEEGLVMKASIVFSKNENLHDIVDEMKNNDYVEAIDIFTLS